MFHGLDALYIYALVDPKEGLVRYVGITGSPVRRFTQHLAEARDKTCNSTKTHWIARLLDEGREPVFVVIEVIKNKDQARDVEARWIEHFAKVTPLLTNIRKN